MPPRTHLELRPPQRWLSLAFLMLLTGCQSLSTASSPRLRVIDLSADAGTLDIYQGAHALAYNLVYGNVTSYVTLAPGTITTTVVPAGSKQTISAEKTTLVPGSQYTLLLHGQLAALRQTLLIDQAPTQPASVGPMVRFLHQAERTGPVDIYFVPAGTRLSARSTVLITLPSGVTTGYLPVPAGAGTVMILPAGTRPASSLALHTSRQVEYLPGSARTMILLDASPTLARSLDVIEADDLEP